MFKANYPNSNTAIYRQGTACNPSFPKSPDRRLHQNDAIILPIRKAMATSKESLGTVGFILSRRVFLVLSCVVLGYLLY
jgi:hypothetical protein